MIDVPVMYLSRLHADITTPGDCFARSSNSNEIYLVLTLLGGAGLLHGSSRSHWLRKKTSSSPMKSMKDEPPHVEAKVGPVDVISGQLQLIWNRNVRAE